jgi:hypothetical protein
MKHMEIAKLAVRVCLIGILVFGVVGVAQTLLSGMFSTLGLPMRSAWWRLPLSVTDIVVDKNGRIYTWNASARIQVYDSNGKFLNGWSFGKDGWLLLGQDGESLIVVRYNQSSIKFDSTGRQLEQWEDPGRYLEISCARTLHGAWVPTFEDIEGNIYRQAGWILHRIVRIDSSGRETVIVRDPIYVGMFDFILCFLLVLFSLAVLKLGPRIMCRKNK